MKVEQRMLRGTNIHIKKLMFNIQNLLEELFEPMPVEFPFIINGFFFTNFCTFVSLRFHGTSSRQCPHLDHMVQTSKAYIKDDNMTTEEGLS